MVLSSKLFLKESNDQKIEGADEFINEFDRMFRFFLHRLWEMYLRGEKIPAKFRADQRPRPQKPTWLLERPVILAIQQASSVIRGVVEKIRDLERQISIVKEQIEKNGPGEEQVPTLSKLENMLEKSKKEPRPPKNKYCSLSSKVGTLEKSNETTFDFWFVLHDFDSRDRGRKIYLPLKSHSHFKKLSRGAARRMGGATLRPASVQINFEFSLKEKETGETVGIDIGENSLFHLSTKDGSLHFEEDKMLREDTYKKLNAKVHRKETNSKAQKKAMIQRKNYINEQFNRLDLSNIKTVRREAIYNFTSWRYQFIFESLDRCCFKQNVFVEGVRPRHTSQRCSTCGWTCEKSRRGDAFRCVACGARLNADENASRNLADPRLQGLCHGTSDSQAGYAWGPRDGRIVGIGSPPPTESDQYIESIYL